MALAGETVLSFHPEDLLLILCVHGAKHYWARLNWICDIAELIRGHQGIHWERVMEQAVRLRSERILFLGLLLAGNLLGAALPENILQRDAFSLRMREWLWDRVRYLLHRLPEYLYTVVTPNTRDQAMLVLPLSLSFLYYLLRPSRLLRDYGWAWRKSLLRRLRPHETTIPLDD